MTIDFRALLRRRKLKKHHVQLMQRSCEHLVEWTALIDRPPTGLVLDATVYIHRAAGKLPQKLRGLVDDTHLFHCSVAVAELATGVANADPARPSWPVLRDHYAELFDAIPNSRLLTPDA